ncbi:hypothetical protein HZB01_02165 [Candidatus Woesearchaeota archaeon]|nr:hypothetical protein [Candidatus Woesearchaeota archaeon]
MMQKRGLLLVVFLLLMSLMVYAENNSLPVSDTALSQLAPPSLPSDDIGDTVKVYLIMRDDTPNREVIKGVHVMVEIENLKSKTRQTNLYYVDDAGSIELNIPKNPQLVTLKIDLLNTTGSDFFITSTIDPVKQQQYTLYVLPVGTVRGTISNRKGNVIPYANVKFQCTGQYGDLQQAKTDEYGSFFAGWLPIGECRVMAFSDNAVGSQIVQVTKGSAQQVDIVLDKTVAGGGTLMILTLVGLLMLAVFFIFIVQRKKMKQQKAKLEEVASFEKKEEHKIKKLEQELQQEKIKQRTYDILETLKDREREIVEYLLKNGFESTQAKLKHSLGIPKTSLSRIFSNLERKKVVNIESIGKMKKIRLTPWFLGEK